MSKGRVVILFRNPPRVKAPLVGEIELKYSILLKKSPGGWVISKIRKGSKETNKPIINWKIGRKWWCKCQIIKIMAMAEKMAYQCWWIVNPKIRPEIKKWKGKSAYKNRKARTDQKGIKLGFQAQREEIRRG
jgi:hypothetical protein